MECKNLTAIERQMQQAIDQLRANAKSHKKTVDKMSAKLSQLTQKLGESERERMILVGQLNEATAVIMRGAGDSDSCKPDKVKAQSDLSKALCFTVMTASAGFFMAMGAALALFSIGVIGK